MQHPNVILLSMFIRSLVDNFSVNFNTPSLRIFNAIYYYIKILYNNKFLKLYIFFLKFKDKIIIKVMSSITLSSS